MPRQRVVSPLKAKRRRRANAFPLRGRCRTDGRRMRWGANHRCNPIAAVQLRRRPRSALPLILPNRKSKTLPRPHTATACPRLQDATSSVGSRRQLSLKGKPLAMRPRLTKRIPVFLHIAARAEKRPTNRRFRAIGGGAGLAFFGFYDTIKREKGPNPSQTGPCLPCRPSTPSKLLIF